MGTQWGTGEEVSPSWDVYPDGGDNTWTETDEEQLADEWDYLLLFDPPMSVEYSEADDDFDNDVDGATAFSPRFWPRCNRAMGRVTTTCWREKRTMDCWLN